MYNDDNMNDLIDQKLKTISEEYDKVLAEYQERAKKIEELVAQHKVLSEIKDGIENGVEDVVKAGETIIVKNKGTK